MGSSAWSRTAPAPLESDAVEFVQWLADRGFSRSKIDGQGRYPPSDAVIAFLDQA